MPAGKLPGSKKHPNAGRKKGTPNKRTWDIVRVLNREGFDPVAKLVQFTLDAEEAFKDCKKARMLQEAAPFLATASKNCAELCKYVYPQRKAVDVTTGGKTLTNLTDIFSKVISEQGNSSSGNGETSGQT